MPLPWLAVCIPCSTSRCTICGHTSGTACTSTKPPTNPSSYEHHAASKGTPCLAGGTQALAWALRCMDACVRRAVAPCHKLKVLGEAPAHALMRLACIDVHTAQCSMS